ncbi:MAG TPA: hypothetical protein VD962_11725, partial [Rubricoccaceae bacterium]|nr:hypothetical protein [Rubricoccaceae bacterium]
LGVEGGDLYAGTSASGVFRSTNLGESWDPVNNGLPTGEEVTALASAGNALFAGIWRHGVWRSLNDGASWEPVNNGLPPMSTWGGPSTFAVVGSEVFVCVLTVQGTEGGVFRTSTLGDVWAPTNNGLPSAGTQRANAVYAAGGLLFAHTPYHPPGQYLYRSANLGTSWEPASTGLPQRPVQTIYGTGSTVYAGFQTASVYRSTDGGLTWAPSNKGLASSDVQSLLVVGPDLYAGVYSNGVHRTVDGGETWVPSGTSLPVSGDIQALGFSDALYAGFDYGGGVYRSTDAGASWAEANVGLTYYGRFIKAFLRSGGGLFAGTADGVFFRPDGGTNWTPRNTGLPGDGGKPPGTVTVFALAENAGRLFAGVGPGLSGSLGLFRSDDGGASWTFSADGIPTNARLVHRLLVHEGVVYAGTIAGVYRSTDNGLNWEPANTGLPVALVMALAAHGERLLVSFGDPSTTPLGGLGVFTSTNGGTTWVPFEEGLLHESLVSAFAVRGDTLYAATDTRGVYRRFDGVVANEPGRELPEGYALSAAHPNPFSDATTLTLRVARAQRVTLDVYDALGRRVATLHDGPLAAGAEHRFTFEGGALPSGAYAVRVVGEDFTAARTITRLR